MLSQIQIRSHVTFPAYMAEKVYMQEFRQSVGLPEYLSRWQPTVDAMLAGITTDAPIYLMVDQAEVRAGKSHRRDGIHVDGFWHPGGHDEHRPIGCHSPGRTPGHRRGRHDHEPPPSHGGHQRRGHHMFGGKETILLAPDVSGCAGYVGEYIEARDWNMGDCSHVNSKALKEVVFRPGVCYGGDTISMLHESLPLTKHVERTVVRLNVPGVSLWGGMH